MNSGVNTTGYFNEQTLHKYAKGGHSSLALKGKLVQASKTVGESVIIASDPAGPACHMQYNVPFNIPSYI